VPGKVRALIERHREKKRLRARGRQGLDYDALGNSYSEALREGLQAKGATKDLVSLFNATKKSRHDAIRAAIHENALDRMGIIEKGQRGEIRRIVRSMEHWEWMRSEMGHPLSADSPMLIQRRGELERVLGGKRRLRAFQSHVKSATRSAREKGPAILMDAAGKTLPKEMREGL
jgi:hypothetical protein